MPRTPEWLSRMRDRYLSVEDLPADFPVAPDEAAYAKRLPAALAPPFAVTRYFLSLAGRDRRDPIRRQFMPDPAEERALDYELDDPLGENGISPCPRLIRRYGDRALLLVTGQCAAYCRYCFRRSFAGGENGFIADAQLATVLDYLVRHPEIRQLLLSGGDPLTASDGALDALFGRLRTARPDITLRVCTRMPSFLPERITDDLVALIGRRSPVWFAVQFNHPRELTRASEAALARIVEAGMPILDQTVLLKGINDSAETLAELFERLVALRVKPYYLFQGDLAKGTGGFRVGLDRGAAVYAALGKKVSPLALPRYAVDLPGGGGKIPLGEGIVSTDAEGFRTFESPLDGKAYRYPIER
jgi:lysine 2,3-aminomutase